jgi:Gpi18-like mannosyltransferase
MQNQTNQPRQKIPVIIPALVKYWWSVPVLLVVAIVFRVGYITNTTGSIDLDYFIGWIGLLRQYGLFGIYRSGINYPPLYITMLYFMGVLQTARGLPISLAQPDMLFMLKIVPLVAELVMIGAVGVWVRRRKVIIRWAIPAWLAVSPGVIIITAWRGQVDSIVILFMVLALIMLNRDQPRWAWAMYALAILTKPLAIFIGPLLLVLTFRRYGWLQGTLCLAIFAAILTAVCFPFVIGSGLDNVAQIYLGIAGHNTEITAHALNFWYLANPSYPVIPHDELVVLGPLSAHFTAYLIFGVLSLLVLLHVWRNPQKRYEFVWAAALNLGFFVFLTGVFERYLYYAAVLLPIAVAQEGQLWGVALGVTYTMTLNNINIWIDNHYDNLGDWLGWFLWWGKFYVLAAALNVAMSFETLRLLGSGGNRFKWFFQLTRIVTVAIGVVLVYGIARDPLSYYPTAAWLTDHVAASTRIGTENVEITRYAADINPAAISWDWRLMPTVDSQTIAQWQMAGIDYVVLNEWANLSLDFNTRVNHFVAQGGTLLYQTDSFLKLNARQAVIWTAQPQTMTNVSFDGILRLVGYDLLHSDGTDALRLYWSVEQTPVPEYHLFLHLVDSSSGTLVGQNDTVIGQFVHPPTTWQLHQVVIEQYALPPRPDGSPYVLQAGLYQLPSGQRAVLKDQAGHNQGDHLDIPVK